MNIAKQYKKYYKSRCREDLSRHAVLNVKRRKKREFLIPDNSNNEHVSTNKMFSINLLLIKYAIK